MRGSRGTGKDINPAKHDPTSRIEGVRYLGLGAGRDKGGEGEAAWRLVVGSAARAAEEPAQARGVARRRRDGLSDVAVAGVAGRAATTPDCGRGRRARQAGSRIHLPRRGLAAAVRAGGPISRVRWWR